MIYLQVVTSDFLQGKGEERQKRTLLVHAARGNIFDRHHKILAKSDHTQSLRVNPVEFNASQGKIAQLAQIIDIPLGELKAQIDGKMDEVYIKHGLSQTTISRALKLGITGLYSQKEYRRHYPYEEETAHMVGFVNRDGVGQDGIEQHFNTDLTAYPGKRQIRKDPRGNIIEDLGVKHELIEGKDITLSIDTRIQHLTYTYLLQAIKKSDAIGGQAVVIDTETGEILSMVSLPTFNPNQRDTLRGAGLRNQTIADVFEPGSVMKPFSVAAAIELGRVSPETSFLIPDKLVINGVSISDSHEHPKQLMTVSQILQKSSNVGTVQISQSLRPSELWEIFRKAGIGTPPPAELPKSLLGAGQIRPPKSWAPIDKATISYGYGISASLFQIARAYTAFARNGDMVQTTLLRRDNEVPVTTQLISPRTAQTIRDIMEGSVGLNGTGALAKISGYRVAGKTGTAYKYDVKTKRYNKNKYRALFVGLAPVSQPRLVVAVMIDEPRGKYYGGEVAAPIFQQITEDALRILNIPPDANTLPSNKVLAEGTPSPPYTYLKTRKAD